ncbi:MAG TPA: ATP-binding protein, partial [Polyangiaceae bacterium]|nr:ATP-binding protein [Polyangiaceae bacterium]
MASSKYTAESITVLEGLDPVRKRPGMYIGGVGSTGLHHLVWEIVDNSVDEAMNGHATEIAVTLHKDGQSITVSDDGRGIPIDIHPKHKKSALEIVYTTLHAGGKFGDDNYKTAGGLHGVGASVVNALSSEVTVTVKRDGAAWSMEFHGGAVKSKLKKLGAARGSGTTVHFRPDPTIFPRTDFNPDTIRERLEIVSYLHRGVTVRFNDETHGQKYEYSHAEGLVEYLRRIVTEAGARAVHEAPFTLARDEETRLEVAFLWTEATEEKIRSYVNGIPTGSGGTHENGLRSGLVKAVRNYIDTH